MTGPPAALRPLRLRARDPEDLAILSAYLQDAILPVADIAYLADEGRFVAVANRFKWEAGAQPADEMFGSDETDRQSGDGPVWLRTNCGLRVEHARAVRSRGVTPRDRGALLELLAIRFEGGSVTLDFAGGPAISISVDALDIFLEDVGEPWPTGAQPSHVFEDDARTS